MNSKGLFYIILPVLLSILWISCNPPSTDPNTEVKPDPATVLKLYNDTLVAATAKAQATNNDLNSDPDITTYQCSGDIAGTFTYTEITSTTGGLTFTTTYNFNNYNDSGTVFNCPTGKAITHVSNPGAGINSYTGHVDLTGNVKAYVEPHDDYVDVNGTQMSD